MGNKQSISGGEINMNILTPKDQLVKSFREINQKRVDFVQTNKNSNMQTLQVGRQCKVRSQINQQDSLRETHVNQKTKKSQIGQAYKDSRMVSFKKGQLQQQQNKIIDQSNKIRSQLNCNTYNDVKGNNHKNNQNVLLNQSTTTKNHFNCSQFSLNSPQLIGNQNVNNADLRNSSCKNSSMISVMRGIVPSNLGDIESVRLTQTIIGQSQISKSLNQSTSAIRQIRSTEYQRRVQSRSKQAQNVENQIQNTVQNNIDKSSANNLNQPHQRFNPPTFRQNSNITLQDQQISPSHKSCQCSFQFMSNVFLGKSKFRQSSTKQQALKQQSKSGQSTIKIINTQNDQENNLMKQNKHDTQQEDKLKQKQLQLLRIRMSELDTQKQINKYKNIKKVPDVSRWKRATVL